MEFTVGQPFFISFMIDGEFIMTSAAFTGQTVTIRNETIYLFKHVTTGREYGFTADKLKTFRGLNDSDARGSADSITL